jgi:beta-galactosidase
LRDVDISIDRLARISATNRAGYSQGISNVTISDTPLINWNMTAYVFSNVSSLRDMETIVMESGLLIDGPVFLRGRFTINDQPLDTYLDTTGWGKGVAFINGRNLGRYWPVVGPQITLYVPAPYLRIGMNELILLELDYVSQTRKMKFQSVPNLG